MTTKPSTMEEEHFARTEFETRKKLAQAIAARMEAEEAASLQKLHFMHCPKDGSELLETLLRGVKVDICSKCGGMWLDSGELDALADADQTGLFSRVRNVFRG